MEKRNKQIKKEKHKTINSIIYYLLDQFLSFFSSTTGKFGPLASWSIVPAELCWPINFLPVRIKNVFLPELIYICFSLSFYMLITCRDRGNPIVNL